MSKPKSIQASITREALARAVRKFLRDGGSIQSLSPERVILRPLVGQHWAQFERVAAYGGEVDSAR